MLKYKIKKVTYPAPETLHDRYAILWEEKLMREKKIKKGKIKWKVDNIRFLVDFGDHCVNFTFHIHHYKGQSSLVEHEPSMGSYERIDHENGGRREFFFPTVKDEEKFWNKIIAKAEKVIGKELDW